MIRLRNISDDSDDGSHSSLDVGSAPSQAEPSGARQRKPRGIPTAPAAQLEAFSYLNPTQVAAMWGISHDKVLEFIKDGELVAFNVASKTSRRPQFKVTLAAVKAFEERRTGRDPSRPSSTATPRRGRKRNPQAPTNKFF
jgi:hypothetical protein